MEFRGALTGIKKKTCGISRSLGFWPCQIFGGKALFCPELNAKCSMFGITYQVVIKSANHYFFLN